MQGLRKHFPEDWIYFVDCGFLSLPLTASISVVRVYEDKILPKR